jgi:hypothetical protein
MAQPNVYESGKTFIFSTFTSKLVFSEVPDGLKLKEGDVSKGKVHIYYTDHRVWVEFGGSRLRYKTDGSVVVTYDKAIKALDDPLLFWVILEDVIVAEPEEMNYVASQIIKYGGYKTEEDLVKELKEENLDEKESDE